MPLITPRPIRPELAQAYRSGGWWLDLTLTDLLRRQVKSCPDAPAMIAGDRRLTFADVERESDRVAAGLARLGIGRGDVVSCQIENIPEALILQNALAKRRAILNPIHPPYRAAEVEQILAFAESRIMIVDRHRGRGYPRTPATPPCIRVRTRRFDRLR